MKFMKSALPIFSISLLALASLSFTAIPVEEELEFLPVVVRSSSVANYGVDSDTVAFGPVKASIVDAAAADLGLTDPVIAPEETEDENDGSVPSIQAPDETAPDDSVIPDDVDKNDYKDGDPDDGNNGTGNDEDKDSNPDDGNNGSGNDDKPAKEKKDKKAKVENAPSIPIPGGGTDNKPEKEKKDK